MPTNYTPQQIESAERWLAGRVIGLVWRRPVKGASPRWCLPPGDNSGAQPPKDWHPCSNPAHAAMCRDKAAGLGFHIQADWYQNGTCNFFLSKMTMSEKDNFRSAVQPTESLASSIALALATGWKPEEANGKA